jgi:hypothetical protein
MTLYCVLIAMLGETIRTSFTVLTSQLPRGARENHENPHSGLVVTNLSFEPGTQITKQEL